MTSSPPSLSPSRVFLAVSVLVLAAASLCGADTTVEGDISKLQFSTVTQNPCVKLMTATGHSVGCSTGGDGVTGALVYVRSAAAVSSVAAMSDDPKRTVLLPISLFTPAVLTALQSYKQLAGIVVLSSPASPPAAFSPASSADEPTSSYPWNPAGLDLLSRRFPFPIVSVGDAGEAARLVSLALENEKTGWDKYPQHAAHFYFDMGPDGLTSTQCLEDGSCLPLGGQSVWATIGDVRDTTEVPKPIVMAAAKLDATAFFHDLAFGTEATLSGLVAVLAAADALHRSNVDIHPKRVAFGVFQGEAYGRMGSRRFVEEATKPFDCDTVVNASTSSSGFPFCQSPLRPSLAFRDVFSGGLDHLVGVDQVGLPGTTTAYTHRTGFAAEVMRAVATQDAALPTVELSVVAAPNVPVTPATSFPGDVVPDVTVMSDYDSAFRNPYYHSQYDGVDQISTDVVTGMSTLLARTMYGLATGMTTASDAAGAAKTAGVAANATLVQTLIDCFTANASCTFFADVISSSGQPLQPFSLYTGVYNAPFPSGDSGFGVVPTHMELFTRNFLAHYTATPHGLAKEGSSCASSSDCRDEDAGGDKRLECVLDTCIVSTSFFHDAFSLSLDNPSYGVYRVNASRVSNLDPAWTEPYWSGDIGVQTFLLDNPVVGRVMFGIGFVVMAASAVGVYFLHRAMERMSKAD